MKYWFYIVQGTHTVGLFKNMFLYGTHSVKNEILSILNWDQALFSFRFENYIPAGKAKRKESPNFSGSR